MIASVIALIPKQLAKCSIRLRAQSQRCSKLLPEKRSLPHKSARSRDVTDTEIARVKRSIDQFNQQRNDWMEKVDDEITLAVEKTGVAPEPDALNLIDR